MVKSFKIPWAAWRDPDFLDLSFPDSWEITACRMNGADGPVLNDNEIKQSILNPIGTLKISELANSKEKVAIVVEDMTRTTQETRIIPNVI